MPYPDGPAQLIFSPARRPAGLPRYPAPLTTRWTRAEAESEDPVRIAIREALAFGKAVYDRRVTVGLSVAELAMRAGMTADEIECIEEGGTEATIPLLRRLAAALDADVRLTPGHDLGSVGFETHAA